MLQKFKQLPWYGFKKLFKTDETRFIMSVGFKVSGISFGVTLFIYYFFYLIVRMNYAFFQAHGFPVFIEDSPFFDYIVSEALDNLPVFFLFHIFLFFIGTYVGWLILRPFQVIGDYCEKVLENPNYVYKIDEFSNYRLLTRFSEFFFEYLRDSRAKGEISTNSIPPQFSKIHRPLLDWVFLLHFGILLVIIAICSSFFIIENITAIYETMIELGAKTLSDKGSMNKFFGKQMFIVDELIVLSVSLITLFYILLGLHLYAKVSGAAFGIFSTMRSFMKGAHFSRVHLVGYGYIRDYTRKLNKYLEYIENNLSKQKPKG